MQLNELQKFVKNFLVTILASLSTALFNMLIISHLAKSLTPDGFGQYSFLLTYSSYFMLFTSLGIDIVAIRAISMNKDNLKNIFWRCRSA